ncbi:MAG: hypothetical protein ACRC8K_11100 [Waterburya sp.]
MLCEIGGQIIFPETFFDDFSSLSTLGQRDRSLEDNLEADEGESGLVDDFLSKCSRQY